MQNRSDEELLKDFAELGSETAFREIVTRYTDLVYSAAIRQVQSPDLARDVGEAVDKWDKMIAGKTDEQLKKDAEMGAKLFIAFEITGKQVISDNEVALSISPTEANGKVQKTQKLKLQKVGNLWKVAGPASESSAP